MYSLPYTVAEGFAGKHGVERSVFLRKIEPQMTKTEREKLVRSAAEHQVELNVEMARMPLMRLSSYVLALPLAERGVCQVVGAQRHGQGSAPGVASSHRRETVVEDQGNLTAGAAPPRNPLRRTTKRRVERFAAGDAFGERKSELSLIHI